MNDSELLEALGSVSERLDALACDLDGVESEVAAGIHGDVDRLRMALRRRVAFKGADRGLVRSFMAGLLDARGDK